MGRTQSGWTRMLQSGGDRGFDDGWPGVDQFVWLSHLTDTEKRTWTEWASKQGIPAGAVSLAPLRVVRRPAARQLMYLGWPPGAEAGIESAEDVVHQMEGTPLPFPYPYGSWGSEVGGQHG